MLEFRVLGPLEVVDERGRIGLGGRRQRATLAILLLNANRVVSMDRLADDLYAGAAPATALKQVQRQISELRRLLGSEAAIETRSPGYVIRLDPAQLDLSVFEQLMANAADARAAGDVSRAADLLRKALGLWRGTPLADLAYDAFARAPIERLEEMRLVAVEQRVDAELALGHHAQLTPELEQLVADHPLREQLRAQLMLALYGSGRQADALAVYRQGRDALVEGFGIEPGDALRQLERRILAHDPSLGPPESREPERIVLAVPHDDSGIARLLALAGPLGSELIAARLVAAECELAAALESLRACRQKREPTTRIAAFVSGDVPADVVRLATAYDVELVVIDAPTDELSPDIATLLEHLPADVALAAGAPVDWTAGNGIFVPFGGAGHDWAALELAARLASSAHAPLRLVGSRADPARGQRDASRLLANASLAVQRLVAVSVEPMLLDATANALLTALEQATVIVAGLSARWRTDGLGAVRQSLLSASPPVVLVHGGPRPSGLAPRDARTRFSWSLAV